MYNYKVQTKPFDTSKPKDLEEYDKILNNPLCNIIYTHTEKVSDKCIGGEGEPTIIQDRVLMIVSWKEKVLL